MTDNRATDARPTAEGSRLRLALSAGIAAASVAVLLVALKLWGLLATGALTIGASLADSAADLLISLGAIAAILYAARPPDEDHAFGHSAAEDLFALAQALLVAGSAAAITWSALGRIGHPAMLGSEASGIAVMAAASMLTLGLVLWQSRVVRRTGSQIVAADRLHYLSDLVPNLAAIAALAASRLWSVAWPDTALSLLAAGMLLAGALRIGRRAVDGLMDREADAETVATIRGIAEGHEGLAGYHDLRTRRSGSRIFVQIHVEIDGARSLREAHDIGARLRRKIMAAVPDADVIVHKDPAGPGA
ncbi:cation diffusion facilitator family transporter [Paralimibaculum aggregatum]|uniref:Cation diffusion facilitator family transporter n=1 Tax=Paralimibaculum aggregatum TaxID=3036245 RepID=A0ABQ6LPG7_9RHOB|nr:cation diffusion facilitator family transporter [Limibaculum sp. NKW23]GMG83203.1 cation diffusion facilitator family transporter [Limibaculum sp. NKW23]